MKSNADWRFCPALPCDRPSESGFTLVEMLVTMCVSLMLLGGVVSLFGSLGESVNDSKSDTKMLQTVRHAGRQLASDLGNLSLVPNPAETEIDPQGFFEYVEGPYNDARLDLGGGGSGGSGGGGGGEPTEAITIDNGDAGFAATSQFDLFTNTNIAPNMYGGNNHNAQYGPAGGEATWTFTELPAGEYQVAAHWDHKYNNNYNDQAAAFTILDGTAAVGTATVNQKNVPNEFEADGYFWNTLETVDISSGTLVVKLERGPVLGRSTVADAIRIQCLDCGGGGGGGGETALNLVGDCDDVLHFTTKTDKGAHEVVWFLTPMPGTEGTENDDDGNAIRNAKGTRYRLHRYARPVEPNADANTTDDLSFGADGTPNSLEDLALRRNRFAHFQDENQQFTAIPQSDYETILMQATNNPDGTEKKQEGQRIRETTILENVLAFDVRIYDPKANLYQGSALSAEDWQTYADSLEDDPDTAPPNAQLIALGPSDLGYAAVKDAPGIIVGQGAFVNLDYNLADGTSPLQPDASYTTTYDSWSDAYVQAGEVGFDNDNDGVVDTAEDLRQSPPYGDAVKAVQIEIRMIEPKSGNVRSVKIRKYLGKK